MPNPPEPLTGIRVVAPTTNVPGPVAAGRLAAMGAEVIKLEPPGGDLLALVAPGWYAELTANLEVRQVDLRAHEGVATVRRLLAGADLFLTTLRQGFLTEAGLDQPTLSRDFPELGQVLIVGEPPPHHERCGHDLTYLARTGLLNPDRLPPTLMADLSGAEYAVSAALGLLLARQRNGQAGTAWVALSAAAEALAAPRRHGLTTPGGLLGGGLPTYRCYRTADNRWVACAMLEPKFSERFQALVQPTDMDEEALATCFSQRSAEAWEALAREHDLPIAVVQGR